MATHLISFGHHPNADKGAIYKNRNEATEVRRIKPYLEKWAKKSKHNFKHYTRDMFADRNIHQHKHFDSITELHMDAPQGNGGHVIIHKDFKPDNIDKRLRDVIKKHFGIVGYLQNSNGFSYRNNLYNINQAAKHGINYRLVEMFFLSNEQDYNHYINNLDAIAKDIIQAITGETLSGKVNTSKPSKKPVQPSKPAPSKPNNNLYGAKLVKNEKAKYTVTASNGIKVRNAPSTKATHTGTLKKGQSINYDQVYEGNGYRWLAYDSHKGRRYLPYRPLSGKNEQWGYFGSAPTNKPKPKKKTLHLPKSVRTWRVYRPNGPYTVGNEIHLLTPSAFKNGITYEILEEKGGHVYIINTGVKGRVAIYAGPDTAAVIK